VQEVANRDGAPAVSLTMVAGLFGLSGVALGAFGAHALKGRLTPELLEVYKTGVFYQLIHAVVLLAIAGLRERLRVPRLTATLFATGVTIFSGSLYLLALSGVRLWGAVTPFGGLALLAGWVTILLPAPRRK
jgi:uncharacterized membrane protein YgdD (TMEM256/DUF423 family)